MLPLLSGLLILARLSPSAALEDLETAAITVYRNPDFFRHLSHEFNNHVNQFSKDPYPYGPKDEYQSPVGGDNFFQQLNDQYENTFPKERGNQEDEGSDSNEQEHQEEENEDYSDVPENHRESYRDDGVEDDHESEEQNEEAEDSDDYKTEEPKIRYPPLTSDNYKYPEEPKIRYPPLTSDNYKYPEEPKIRYPPLTSDDYKYPGEPKKPNPPVRPSVNVHFDGSPDFDHPARNLPPPQIPKKKGRGPYGHPRYHHDEYPRYSEEYENDRGKSEEQQLVEIEDESRRHNEENGHPPPESYYQEYSRTYPEQQRHVSHPLPLKIYHQGQRYPVEPDEYDGYENKPYPLRSEELIPGKFKPSEEIRDNKKGTREYLRHAQLPPHHELQDSELQNHRKPKRVVKISCDTRIKPKRKKNTYIAYKIRPVYSKYRIASSPQKKLRRIYYVKSPQGHYRRRSVPPTKSKLVDDDSAYVINSEFDQDYQRLEVLRTKKPQ